MTRYELPPVDDRVIWDIWLSAQRLPALAVAHELGMFEALAAGPATAAELAQRLGFDPRGTDVVLAMVAALGLAQRTAAGEYALGDAARLYLLRDSPYYWGPLLRVLGVVPRLHLELLRAVKPSAAKRAERPADSWASGHMTRETAEMVTAVMHCHSLPAAVAVAESGGFAGTTRLLDVGGGSGVFAIAIAQRHPQLACTILELPAVCEVAGEYVARGGVADRVATAAIDMFRDPWPAGHDAVLFSNVFHDWSFETNAQLAASAFAALPSGGRIVLHEMLAAPEAGPVTTAAFSVLMLTTTEGQQYTLAELTRLLDGAGFTGVAAAPSYGYYSLVTATKP